MSELNITVWYRIRCPKCKSVNWLSNGDPTDCTAMDVEGLRCFKCKHEVALNEDILYVSENIYFEDGMEHPR